MKSKKKIAVLLCACMMLSLQLLNTYAAEKGYQDVPVSYSPSDDAIARFHMNVVVVGNGYVYDGTQKLEGNKTIFELKYKDEKTFKIQAMDGYHLTSIIFDGVDITNQLKDGYITVSQLRHDTVLTFTYEKIKEPDNGTSEPDNNNGNTSQPTVNGPDTGDHSNVKNLLLMGAVSGVFIFLFIKKRNEEESENN